VRVIVITAAAIEQKNAREREGKKSVRERKEKRKEREK